ncbi:hypothetical protein ACA910_004578 [Epithemia clementina (nom. ined.)]
MNYREKNSYQLYFPVVPRGMGGYAIMDKVTKESGHMHSYNEPIAFSTKDTLTAPKIDHVYIHPNDHPVLEYVTINGNLAIEGTV